MQTHLTHFILWFLTPVFCVTAFLHRKKTINIHLRGATLLKLPIMIIYNNKGNPHGLKVEICVRAAGSNIKIQEITSDGMCDN